MITFNFQDVLLKLNKKQLTKVWLKEVISAAKYKTGDINYIFCNDDFLSELNIKYLKHNTLTDIITFDYSEKNTISGDIYISIERVSENAHKYNKTFDEELHRVMAHGILHLTGLNDKTDEERNFMRKREEECLALFYE